MKVNKQEQFVPFDLVLSIESKEEAQALYAIFNKQENASLLGNDKADMVDCAIGSKYYIASSHKVIANGITHGEYYY